MNDSFVTFPERRQSLQKLIRRSGINVMPGVANAVSAQLVEKVGFELCYVTGSGIANAEFGLPDLGLVSMAESLEQVRRIAHSTNLPLIVDMDDGYGSPINVFRSVRLFEAAGASGIQIEDQMAPKKCGHFEDHRLVSIDTMQAKIDAAARARVDGQLVIVARTDAYGTLGVEGAITRAARYAEAGADVLFVEAPASFEDMRQITDELAEWPLVINVVEGGKTPELTVDEYGEIGFNIALFANFVLRCMTHAAEHGLRHLHSAGETRSMADQLTSWADRQDLAGLPRFAKIAEELERHWDSSADASRFKSPFGPRRPLGDSDVV